jgi:predicted AlkP superfamily pyrophosphatase or phosphodiesterase
MSTIVCAGTGGRNVGDRPSDIAAAQGQSRPRLIVLITVDQLRGDMLDRFAGELRYGYARLMRGARFVNAFQDHAITETAPGHASLLSGRFPASTGIFSNSAGVYDPDFDLVAGLPTDPGASPRRFQGTTLVDWLTARDSRTRAFSVSMKDRGAILPIGRSKQEVYWYSVSGSFTTSRYYRTSLPRWVADFNAERKWQTYAGGTWNLSRDPRSYREPDSVDFENYGKNTVFPHALPSDPEGLASYIRTTPAMDSLTALFALEGLRETGIGRGPQTDVLAVSFSATDVIGHGFGPDSREAHENELRLDHTLGWFLDSLYQMRDSSTVMIALSADHGVQPIPELARARGEATGDQGLRVTLAEQVAAVRRGLRSVGVDTMAFAYDIEAVWIDRAAVAKARISADSILDRFAAAVRRVPGVGRVDRIADLRRADFARDAIARRWSHQIPAERSPVDLVITLTRYSYWNSLPATHGSPYDLDASVPIIFYGPWARAGRYTTFARTVDIGPTLAAIAGVRPTERIDGVILTEGIR